MVTFSIKYASSLICGIIKMCIMYLYSVSKANRTMQYQWPSSLFKILLSLWIICRGFLWVFFLFHWSSVLITVLRILLEVLDDACSLTDTFKCVYSVPLKQSDQSKAYEWPHALHQQYFSISKISNFIRAFCLSQLTQVSLRRYFPVILFIGFPRQEKEVIN